MHSLSMDETRVQPFNLLATLWHAIEIVRSRPADARVLDIAAHVFSAGQKGLCCGGLDAVTGYC